MLPNVIVLAVKDSDGAATSLGYTRYEEHLNRVGYIGEEHSLQALDRLSLYRTFPKTNGNFVGVAKTSLKFSMTVPVTGVDGVSTLNSTIITEVSFSLPVGATPELVEFARQKIVALLDQREIMDRFNLRLEI